MYTYPIYALATRPDLAMQGSCAVFPGYLSDQEAAALQEMAALRQESLRWKRDASPQTLSQLARLRILHRGWRERYHQANRLKHEALHHLEAAT